MSANTAADPTHGQTQIIAPTGAICVNQLTPPTPGFPPSPVLLAGELSVDIFHGLSDGHYEGLHAVLSGTVSTGRPLHVVRPTPKHTIPRTSAPVARRPCPQTTLAGAVVPLDTCVRNLVEYTQCGVHEALAAVTTHPAKCVWRRREGWRAMSLR